MGMFKIAVVYLHAGLQPVGHSVYTYVATELVKCLWAQLLARPSRAEQCHLPGRDEATTTCPALYFRLRLSTTGSYLVSPQTYAVVSIP